MSDVATSPPAPELAAAPAPGGAHVRKSRLLQRRTLWAGAALVGVAAVAAVVTYVATAPSRHLTSAANAATVAGLHVYTGAQASESALAASLRHSGGKHVLVASYSTSDAGGRDVYLVGADAGHFQSATSSFDATLRSLRKDAAASHSQLSTPVRMSMGGRSLECGTRTVGAKPAGYCMWFDGNTHGTVVSIGRTPTQTAQLTTKLLDAVEK